jgi:ubiquinone/menaquinone biosynthesis C-methylase UbiE
MKAPLVLALLSILSIECQVHSQEASVPQRATSVKPGINDNFLAPDLDAPQWVDRFEVESREIFRARTAIVAHLGLRRGDRVADIGTGTGLFVEPFSEEVGPDGWVYALDIAPAFLGRVGAGIDERQLQNVTPILCGQDDVRLPPASIHAAFICDTYHHFEFPATSLASLYRALKPGGQVVVVDFERVPGVSSDWTLDHVRAGKEVFRAEIEAAGFEFAEEVEVEGLAENYFLRFRKP